MLQLAHEREIMMYWLKNEKFKKAIGMSYETTIFFEGGIIIIVYVVKGDKRWVNMFIETKDDWYEARGIYV